MPLVQSVLSEHVLPFGFAPHEPATHGFGGAQGIAAEQVVLQATPLASHVYGVQATAVGATQVPWPSHFAAAVALLVSVSQLAPLHTTSFQRSQWPEPSHLPSLPQLVCDSVSHVGWPAAGALPAASAVHTPGLSGKLHALQLSAHCDWQHTPSAHHVD